MHVMCALLKGQADSVTGVFSSPGVKFSTLLLILLQKGSRVNQHRSISEDFL